MFNMFLTASTGFGFQRSNGWRDAAARPTTVHSTLKAIEAVPFDRIKSGKEEMAIVRFDQLHGVDMEGHVIFRMSFLFVGFVWIIVETVGWAASLFV